MRTELVVIGAALLVASIFGYSYSQEQQSLLDQGQDLITGEQQDWSLIQAISSAGIVGGIVMLVVGLMPEDWSKVGNREED